MFLSLCFVTVFSQNETNKWYFGNHAGLDFMTNPPTILTNNAFNTSEGCASIANAAGSLLFYTDGVNVYDQTHSVMANGSGLLGFSSSSQSAVIVKQPGNTNIYYIFTQGATGNGTRYSIVDMTLASGNGSVTVKNSVVLSSTSEKLTSVKHCNGIDFWILTHDFSGNSFYCYLLSSSGLNTTAVISSVGITYSGNDFIGILKTSPNGKKIADGLYGSSLCFQILDFDNSTGQVSNPLSLGSSLGAAYGVEFSPDGTKLYGTRFNNPTIYQWDLCAGSSTAIVASQYSVCNSGSGKGAIQLASDGKIYVCRYGQMDLGVIGNPNSLTSACNYTEVGQSISPKTSNIGLPNFITSSFKPPPPPFTYTVNNSYGCQGAAFTMPPTINTSTLVGCVASGYSVTGQTWIFGDPASGANNISFLASPIHAYTSLGTYTAMLVINYSCGGGTDTIKQTVVINQPCISVTSTSITCASLGSATVAATGGIGPYSYTWMPSGQTSSVATGLSPGSYTLTVYDFGNNFTYTATTLFTSLIPLTGSISTSNSITCNGASTGTASVSNLAGGSGNQNYTWFNGLVTHTISNPSTLSAGIWTIVVSDAITGCTISQIFFINQPPPLSLLVTATSATACVGSSVVLTGTASGGTPFSSGPAYTYSWSTGLSSNTRTVSHFVSGTFIYSLTSKDEYSCSVSNTIGVDFIANPIIGVTNSSICPLQTGTLIANGASTYTWVNNVVSPTFTDNPLVNTQYTLIGSAFGCTSAASGSIILKPIPSPLLNSNAPICNGQNLNLFGNIIGNGFANYDWTGPFGFFSNVQYPSILNASPNHSGIYNYTVTAANNCTASTSASLTINPTPSVSAAGSTVCVNQSLFLFGNSVSGATYTWTGPGYASNIQNPFINFPSVNASGTYTVKVASAAGCTNMATTHASVTAMPNPIALSDSPKCFGSALNFYAGGGDTYQWLGPNGFNSLLTNPIITNVTLPANGTYTLTITKGPCTTQTTHPVIIHPLPSFTLSSNTPCETKTFNLFTTPVNNVANYLWQGPSGFGSQNQNPHRDSSMTNFSGIYTLTVLDLNTCSDTRTLSATILQNPTITALGTTVCLNERAELIGDGAQDYYWTGPNFYQSNQQNAIIPKASSSVVTIYTLVGTAPNSCTSTVTASLTTNPLPVPSLSVFPKTKNCLNSKISFEGFGGVAYYWMGPGGFNYGGKQVTFTASSLSYSGTYTLIVTDTNGCRNSTLTGIQLDPLPKGNLLGTVMDACVPFSSEFKFISDSSSAAQIKTEWTINSTVTKSGKKFSYDFRIPGEYVIVGHLTDTATTCKNSLTYTVQAHEVPVADFNYSPEHPVENMDEVVFSNTSSGAELSLCNWYFISNDGYRSSQNTTSYLFSDAGNYPVALLVKNKWNCADTIVKTIKVETDFNVYVPNAFTPNNDNLNEVFKPVVRGTTHYEFSVYNRWGEQLFLTHDTSEGWDGNYVDKPCKSDLYVWKVILTSNKGEQKAYKGHVTLYR